MLHNIITSNNLKRIFNSSFQNLLLILHNANKSLLNNFPMVDLFVDMSLMTDVQNWQHEVSNL